MARKWQTWQQSQIRRSLEWYRESLEKGYHIRNKRLVEARGGLKAFSLLIPPLGSHAARRRLRFIARNLLGGNARGEGNGTLEAERRTPHFVTVAVTYRCQCDCAHCSAGRYRDRSRATEAPFRCANSAT